MKQGTEKNEAREVFARNLRRIANEKGITQAEIVAATGCSSATVSDWFNGKKYPRPNRVQHIADYLGVFMSELTQSEEEASLNGHHGPGIRIPVLGRVQAGIPIEAVEEILDYEEITPAMASTGEHFALRIRGTSMEPRMRDGDVIIVRKQEAADTGDTAVVLVNGDEATVKQIKVSPAGITLIPTNPAFDPIFYSHQEVEELPVQIIGKVVELRAKF